MVVPRRSESTISTLKLISVVFARVVCSFGLRFLSSYDIVLTSRVNCFRCTHSYGWMGRAWYLAPDCGPWGMRSVAPLSSYVELPLMTLILGLGRWKSCSSRIQSDRVQSRWSSRSRSSSAQVCSCFKCKPCQTDNENYCVTGGVDTYNSKYENGDIAHGGYATGIRVHERFVFAIPDGLKDEDAASYVFGWIFATKCFLTFPLL